MALRAKLVEIGERVNTRRFAWGGVSIAFSSLAIIGLQKSFHTWALAHLDGVAWIIIGIYDGAYTVGLWCVWPAIIAAMLGRSPAIPKDPQK